MKELKSKSKNKINDDQNKVSYLNKEDPLNKNQKTSNDSKEIFEKIRDEITSLRKEINGMIVTDQSGISDELSHQTPIKLRQEKFSPEIINKLNYSFIGKNLEDGRVSFFRELSRKLASNDFSRILKSKNIFILGNSGSGKSTLAAKLASYLSDAKNTKN